MNTIQQTRIELEKQFEDQLLLLSLLAEVYDKGNIVVAKSIATAVRVLVHDTSISHSLLGQLGMKNGKFFDTAQTLDNSNLDENTFRGGSFSALVAVSMGSSDQVFKPYLDDVPDDRKLFVDFDVYWNKIIFIDSEHNSFTRKEIVLAVANQDGGAHVGKDIDEKYRKLARDNALGWKVSGGGKTWDDPQGVELAAIRQIGHEILRTFKSDYPKQKMVTSGNGIIVGGGGVLISFKNEKESKSSMDTINSNNSIGRNDKCPCKSGLKYKKCHGKKSNNDPITSTPPRNSHHRPSGL